MVIFGASNIGLVRKENQDSYLFDTKDNYVGFAVVCDGMGGVSGGKTASVTAVNSFSSNLKDVSGLYSDEKVFQVLTESVKKANIDIYNKAIEDELLSGMGTTLVSALIVDKKGYFINVGDSRAYIIRDGVIRRITRDHSAVQELVDQGLLTENQARNHPNKNIITRALGVAPSVESDIFTEALFDDDIILLCSDGMTNYVDDLEIPFEIIKQHSLEVVPQSLIELANNRGGADNSTVVVIKI